MVFRYNKSDDGQQTLNSQFIFGRIYERFCMAVSSNLLELVLTERSVPDSQRAEQLNELVDWDERMIAVAARNADIQALLDIATEQLANPIALFDSALVLVASSGDLPEGYERTIWADVLEKGYSPIEFYTADEWKDMMRRVVPHGRPQLFNPSRSPGHENLAALVTVGGRQFGTIGQVDLVAPFSDLEVALAEHVRNRIELALAIQAGMQIGEDEIASLLSRLVQGKDVDGTNLHFHLRKLGMSESDRWRVFVCPLSLEDEGEQGEVTRRSTVRRLSKVLPGSLSITFGGAFIAVTNDSRLDDAACDHLQKALAQMRLTCGMSDAFVGLTNLPPYYRQCRIALDEAERSGRTGLIPFLEAYASSISRLVEEAAPLETYCNQTLLSLARKGYRGDVEQGRELVRQLQVFLLSGHNLRAAARRLYLHRNTLAYRLDRLGELLGANLQELEPDETLRLIISCQLALG